MNRLTKVLGKRMVREKIFLLAVAVTLLLSLFISLTNAPTLAEWAKDGENYSLEDCYYNLAPLLGLIYASFVNLFLGVEYSDGTLRNKLIAGHSRNSVFLSYFIISAIGCLIIMTAWLIGGLPGLFYFDGFSFGWKSYVLYALVSACGALLFAAIFTTITMLIPNKAVSAVASLILWFVLLYIGSKILSILYPPEIDPNPDNVGGIIHYFIEGLSHIIPTCPQLLMAVDSLEKPVLDIVYALATTMVTLFFGCIGFKKKDLK